MYPYHVTDSLLRVKNSMLWLDYWGLVLLTELSISQKSARWNWEMGNAHFLEIISSLQVWILEQTPGFQASAIPCISSETPGRSLNFPQLHPPELRDGTMMTAPLSLRAAGGRTGRGARHAVRAQRTLVQLLSSCLEGCPACIRGYWTVPPSPSLSWLKPPPLARGHGPPQPSQLTINTPGHVQVRPCHSSV